MYSSAVRNPGWLAGVALAVLVSMTAGIAAEFIGEQLMGFEKSPISAIMMAILIGMFVANTIRLPEAIQDGLRFCASAILKVGIMLLGIRLSLLAAGRFTLVALPFVVIAISIGLISVRMIGRQMGLSRQLTGLIAVGTSICGCTAIVATAPLIRANQAEVSYAVACITVFGLAAMFIYPLLAHSLFTNQPVLAGLFLGTSIHETAQVAGAGLMYEAQYNAPVALEIATVTKLVRNLSMIAVIPLVGLLYGTAQTTAPGNDKPRWITMVPWFIVGFAMMSALRTLGEIGERPFGFVESSQWHDTIEIVRSVAEQCLLIAMAAIGLTSMLSGIAKVGLRPFILGLFAALLIGAISIALIGAFAQNLISAVGL